MIVSLFCKLPDLINYDYYSQREFNCTLKSRSVGFKIIEKRVLRFSNKIINES